MKTAMYLRKSRADESGDVAETLSKHKDTLLDFAAHNNLTVIKTYEEVVSGESLFTRPEMMKLLSELEQYDAVLCMDIDRLGRGDMQEQGLIMNKFKYSNTKIITPRDVYNPENEKDEMFFEFKGIIARNELKAIKRRMYQGRTRVIEQGGYIAEAPYGYERDWAGKLPTLKINPEQAEVVKTIFDLYVNKNIGTESIARMINAMGHTTRKNTPFTRNTVRFMLQNKTYIGMVTWDRNKYVRKSSQEEKNRREIMPEDKWIIVKGLHPAIISDDLFQFADEIRKSRSHPPSNTGELKNPFSGLMFCSVCGKLLTRMCSKSDNTPRLYCTTVGCCRGTRQDMLEQRVFDSLHSFVENSKFEPEPDEVENVVPNKILSDLNKNREKLLKQTDNLHDLLEQGIYTVDLFMERKAKVEKQLENIDELINNSGNENKSIRNKNLESDVRKIVKSYWILNAAEKNSLLKKAIDNIIYTKTKSQWMDDFSISINYKFYL